ncbi:MAG: DPP IV N-terminal domain-containing protein [Proteobacteria bacterium]|nr:DPP IV N-terminal domain-containing protein [Pseudomonadota bacterium]
MAEKSRKTCAALLSVTCAAVLSAWMVPRTVWAASDSAAATEARLSAAKPFMSKALAAKVLNGSVTVRWIGTSDRFWFRRQTVSGREYVIVDAAHGKVAPAFDSAAMADALGNAIGKPLDPRKLPIADLDLSDLKKPLVTVDDALFACDLPARRCEPRTVSSSDAEIVSPSADSAVFRRDNNLWLRTLRTGQERQLTSDGVEHFGFGDIDAYVDETKVMRRRAGAPDPLLGVHWSPDGRYVLAVRQDLRKVPARLAVAEFLPPEEGPPVLYIRHESVPADPKRADSYLDLIEVATGTRRSISIDPQFLNDWALAYFMTGTALRWNMRGNELFVIGANRGGTRYTLNRIDLATGQAREVITESSRFNVRLNPYDYARPDVRVSSDGREAIWYSERDGWGHLYLYDLPSGKLKRQITHGDWVVADLVRVDEAARLVYFTAVGREKGRNPYFRHLYRVSLDGGEPQLLTPENADHEFNDGYEFWEGNEPRPGSSVAPSGHYIVDSFSTAQRPVQIVVRAQSGKLVINLLQADDSQLRQTGWQAPEEFLVKAADGRTDLYGVLYKPTHFDPKLKYPVIEQTYPGPQARSTPLGLREHFNYLNSQAFAELGYIVVFLDGRGTAYRSRSFRDTFLGTEDPFGSADHVAALRNLAQTRNYMDLDRVGVTGQSFGGYGSLRATLLHPDFYKVTVSSVGPGDWMQFAGDTSVERFFGVPASSASAREYYDLIDNRRLAGRLSGSLLLIYGGIDEVVSLQSSYRLFKAFIDADKHFDTLIVPDSPHHAGAEPYGVEMSMRYFMEHLGGPTPQ